MAAFHHTPMHRAWLATLVAVVLVCAVTPSSAADLTGVPKNSPSAAVQIVSCSVSIDPENAHAYPEVVLAPVPSTPVKPVSAQVELGLHDALGAGDDTRVLVVAVEKSAIPLERYPVDGNYVGLGCHIRTITFADGTVQNVSYPSTGGSSNGATLGILGGLVLVGGIAAAAGHGGGSSGPAAPGPSPTPTMIPITPSASPTPPPTPTPVPSPTPLPTAVPTASPLPTATPTLPPGSLVVTPQTLTFIAAGPAYSQTSQASEANYARGFTSTPASCLDSNGTGSGGTVNTVASISPPTSNTGLFTITPLGPGTCTFYIKDAVGDQQSINIGVSTTSGTVMTKHRHEKPAVPATIIVRKPAAVMTVPTPTPAPSPSPKPSATPSPRPLLEVPGHR